MHVLWPAHRAAAMTARLVEHDPDRTCSPLLAQMLQEALQALAFHGGKPGERRLCRWWVPPPHRARATCTRFARSTGDVPLPATSACAARSSDQSDLYRKPPPASVLLA